MVPVSHADVLRLGATTGDMAGIGPEVLLKALTLTGMALRARVEVFVGEAVLPWLQAHFVAAGLPLTAAPLGPGVVLRAVPVPSHLEPAVPLAGHSTTASRAQAFAALDALAAAALAGEVDVLVTGPSPKGIFDHLQPRPPGQTEFLAARMQAPRFAMMLAGPRLRVVPVTTHVPLRNVPDLLTIAGIVDCGRAAAEALALWLDVPAPRLAVTGLNPHAGEGGRLGDEEARIIAPAVAALRDHGIDAEGPVVADTVFYRALTGRYDAVLCMYHDQALGPLKTVHFHDGFNLTCGLPVPRISPDHGTAYDIAGQGIADPASMVQTLLQAERMAAARRRSATTERWKTKGFVTDSNREGGLP